MSAQQIVFSGLDADAHTYPPPCVPVLPYWSRDLASVRSMPAVSRFLDDDVLYVRSGRVALASALQAAGLQAGDEVLFPAFHCGSMIEPALWLSLEARFYDLDADLRVHPDAVLAQIRPRTRALVVTHYFGFPQHIAPLRALCEQHGIILIEDCAHAWFGSHQNAPLGSSGHYAIASSVKFFPGNEGGAMVSNGTLPLPRLRAAGWVRNLKAGRDLFEMARRAARRYHPQTPLAPLSGATPCSTPPDWRWFRPQDMGYALDATHRWVLRHTDHAAVCVQRQANYRRLAAGLASLRQARLLYPELPENVIPYKLPLLIEAPETHFPRLKRRGLPIWRWDELAITTSVISGAYRLQLLQLPVHQGLNDQDIDWIIDGFHQELG